MLAALSVAAVQTVAVEVATADDYTAVVCMMDQPPRTKELALRGMENVSRCAADGSVQTGNDRFTPVARGARAEAILEAAPGTRFTSVTWSGRARRADCRYRLQLWADGPGLTAIPIFNLPANEGCPKRGKGQGSNIERRTVPLNGATRIVQRVTCAGAPGRSRCSAQTSNYLRTTRLEVRVDDVVPPTVAVEARGPLATGEWVRGTQELTYSANENAGLTAASANVGDVTLGQDDEDDCKARNRQAVLNWLSGCGSLGGRIFVDTTRVPDGSHHLAVGVSDLGHHFAASPPITARIDNSPPARVEVAVEGGQEWRNRSDFVLAWANAPEPDRAPIAGATYKLCPPAGGECRGGQHVGADLARFSVAVPSPGEWSISMWRRDAAGNETDLTASVPVPLRYDPDPPKVAFEPTSPSDPTLIAVATSDAVSGVADAAIEISATGSGTWLPLSVQRDGDRFLARIEDGALPPGAYQLRARALDHARNETVADRTATGEPLAVTLPLRVVAAMQTAFERQRTIRETVRRGGRTRDIGRKVTVQTQAARVLFGSTAQVVGRLVDTNGVGIAGANVQVLATTPLGTEQPIGAVTTDAEGRYRYLAAGSTNRTLRFVYGGSQVILPTESHLAMTVPAALDLRVDRKRLRNGQTVTFSGPLMTLPTPPGGKLIEMQVRLPGRWETFRTVRSDDAGRWSARYRFRRTSGVQHYRFRARLPEEGNYPFTVGVSQVATVRVKGS